MVKFRGKTKEGKWVYGFYYYNHFVDEYKIFVCINHSTYDIFNIIPSTIAQFTTIYDKKRTKEYPEGQEIYGSIEIDGKMSKGGDIMRTHNPCQSKEAYAKDPYTYSVVVWDRRNACFRGCFGEEIIGNQTDNRDLLK